MHAGAPWDIFCRVIDNFGDIGVCWRLACDLASRAVTVRLWVDDASALRWMAPTGQAGVQVMPWNAAAQHAEPGAVVIEAFGCEPEPAFVARMAAMAKAPVWINLEYLSAEAWVERSHGLPSPQRNGLLKHFFFPGFTAATGGLLREPGLAARQAAFDRQAWLDGLGLAGNEDRLVSLFCYEPPALDGLLEQLLGAPVPTRLLVTHGRARQATEAALQRRRAQGLALPRVSWLPLLSQADYDHLLWACDLNFVRGEDSLVRALWAGKPLVWQAYPQSDQAHHGKLLDWLQAVQAPDSLRAFHRVWNGLEEGTLPAWQLDNWLAAALSSRQRLLAQADLVTQLLEFVRKTG